MFADHEVGRCCGVLFLEGVVSVSAFVFVLVVEGRPSLLIGSENLTTASDV